MSFEESDQLMSRKRERRVKNSSPYPSLTLPAHQLVALFHESICAHLVKSVFICG